MSWEDECKTWKPYNRPLSADELDGTTMEAEQKVAELSRQLAAERDYSKGLQQSAAEARARTLMLSQAIEAVLAGTNWSHLDVRDVLRPALEDFGFPRSAPVTPFPSREPQLHEGSKDG
jgi:hypothetical protein